jgi:deazaflavin-dependent oxidoreductase (nitroreductase family)
MGLSHNYLLEVRGRRSGRVYSTPVNLLKISGKRYVVAPRGTTQWVRNVRLSGRASIVKGKRREQLLLKEVPVPARPEILKAYLDQFKTTVQRYFPVPAGAAADRFEPLADRYPVFELVAAE